MSADTAETEDQVEILENLPEVMEKLSVSENSVHSTYVV